MQASYYQIALLAGIGVLALFGLIPKVFRYFSRTEPQRELIGRIRHLDSRALRIQSHFDGLLASIPAKIIFIDAENRRVVAVSHMLAAELGYGSAGACCSSLDALFSNEEDGSEVLPRLRSVLRSSTPPVDTFDDTWVVNPSGTEAVQRKLSVRLNSDAGRDNKWFLAVIECQPVAIPQDTGLSAHEEVRLLRAALTERNLSRALKTIADYSKKALFWESHVGISVVDSGSGALELVCDTGFHRELQKAFARIPLLYGKAVNTTSFLLGKELCVDLSRPGTVPGPLVELLVRHDIGFWRSFPLCGLDGKVLGSLDILGRNDLAENTDDERLATMLHFATAIIERHKSAEVVQETVRIERLIKAVNQALVLISGDGGEARLMEVLDLLVAFFGFDLCAFELWVRTTDSEAFRKLAVDPDSPSVPSIPASSVTDHLVNYFSVSTEGSGTLESKYQCRFLDETDAVLREVFEATDAEKPRGVIFPMVVEGFPEGFLIARSERRLDAHELSVISSVVPSLAGALERQRLLQKLIEKALFDQLTGLYNRAGIEELLSSELVRSQRYGNPLSVMVFDIDHFKSVNDTYGHDAGDRVLKEVALRVKDSMRSVDFVGRWGGEEFLVILAETPLSNAAIAAEGVRKTVERGEYGIDRLVTVSVGVAAFHEDSHVDSLVKRADLALYEAKRSGRNRVVVEDGSN
ncbi:GGDEF domain-containing protein [Marinobacter sp. ANT_B65]|uniref:GGDEF domain-containing protein n=1 Tax=Marinobacter sp. ANT_B65 TaxID=2039467 RepID=UPI000BBE5B1F|nr:GGDEF domain-containing protein [Marinobacter sp. ANT_B65]PCM44254.1 hypothetical protein CPA50_12130 [Marinobacter sp. ANT_B65]